MMIESGLNDQTVRFFQAIYLFLLDRGQASGVELADHYGITSQLATTQLSRLVAHRYLIRVHYRAWALDKESIRQMLQDRPIT